MVIDHIETYGFEAAIRGMRNSHDSWPNSDSKTVNGEFILGYKDQSLMNKLYNAGPSHRKFMRQIGVIMDVSAPLYWWKEFDTYKVGTTANSCSTMHTLCDKPLSLSDFQFDWDGDDSEYPFEKPEELFSDYLGYLNVMIYCYKKDHKMNLWRTIIQMLPESYIQKRTISLNYEVAATIIDQRAGHKLKEWHEFVKTLLSLPYLQSIRRKEKCNVCHVREEIYE